MLLSRLDANLQSFSAAHARGYQASFDVAATFTCDVHEPQKGGDVHRRHPRWRTERNDDRRVVDRV